MMINEACTLGMAGMGLISLLLIVALVLGIGALAKYLFFRHKEDDGSEQKRVGGDYEHHAGK